MSVKFLFQHVFVNFGFQMKKTSQKCPSDSSSAFKGVKEIYSLQNELRLDVSFCEKMMKKQQQKTVKYI